MKKIKFPKRIAVTVDPNGEGPVAENLLAWKDEKSADEGTVAVYVLSGIFETKSCTRIRKQGESVWEDFDSAHSGSC